MSAPRRTRAALAITVMLLILLGLRVWSSGQAAAISGPTHLRSGDDGKVYLVLTDALLVLSPQGQLLDEIPLSRFGVERLIGDFWVSNQQQILLRAGQDGGGLLRSLRIFNRVNGDGGDQMPAGQVTLQWCALATGNCKPFAGGFRSNRTFKLWRDAASGAFLVADTAQRRLLRLRVDGEVEASSGQDFAFPNTLQLGPDGLLYVADTNHHRIVAVDPQVASFGAERNAYPVQMDILRGRDWPNALAVAGDGTRWVVNAGPDMAHGDLLVYEKDGRIRHEITLPDGADPLSILIVDTRVLVADTGRFVIHVFDPAGNALPAFGDAAFQQELQQAAHAKLVYSRISTGAMGLLIMVFIAALLLYRRAKRLGQI
ncbi:hypothetical protein IGB42_01945 [Andreprevotia sp. IGB-42]|uniref:SMP-30/gluconolactonase/LRE family protein n=1 Tax=Andreprevotia sp. IGB-42 TaxID=2497473 RepID=UPI00135C7C79|nr:SMP-30/gluconolactonase/LRE family protein [Andreprevotia sp. IGB-42]KAF0813594.1 hypothetical protein IGB42_01945 [Andreprevotia sp. IGB-42]